MNKKKFPISPENLWRAGMIFISILFILMGTIVSLRLSTLRKQAESVSHTNNIIHTLDSILITIIGIESSQRMYIITNDESLSRSITLGQSELTKLLTKTRQLISDNSEQLIRFTKLNALAQERTNQINLVLKSWKENSLITAIGLIRTGHGRETLNAIKSTISEMQNEEDILLSKRSLAFESSRVNTSTLAYISVIITILTIILTFSLVKLYQRNEKQLKQASLNLSLTHEALKTSETQFRQLSNLVPQLIWISDSNGIPIYLNEKWYDYTGISHETKMEHIDLMNILHPEDRMKRDTLWSEAVRNNSPYEIEYRLMDKNGEYRWFICRAMPSINETNGSIYWFGTCTDIHENKIFVNEKEALLESERIARNQAEKAIQMKNEFVATLSHELRGPLNAILGWVQIINSKRDDLEIVSRGMDVIAKNSQLQAQLISDIFDIHKINAGKLFLNPISVNMTELVNACADSIEPACKDKNLILNRKITESVCDVEGDPNRLSQAIMNLLNNSVKFTPEGGNISIQLDSVDNFARIEIQDSGIGIEKELLVNIFDKYNQGQVQDINKEGLGLGLSIAKSFISFHKGELTVKSDGLNLGSTFTILLPCTNSEDQTSNSLNSNEKSLSLNKIDILIVEDQFDSRDALKRILTEKGALVVAVSSAEEALSYLKEKVPHIMISDISMPGIDGYTFMNTVSEIYPSLKAIALTAFAREIDRQRAFAAGFIEHVIKPVDLESLIYLIVKHVQK